MTYFMVKWVDTHVDANCFPAIFKTKEDAERYIQEATFYPDEFKVIEVCVTEYEED